MADAVFMYAVVAGIFAFLAAVCLGSRAKRRSGFAGGAAEAGNRAEAA